jgi:adenylyltransferase/sulfurtransferase
MNFMVQDITAKELAELQRKRETVRLIDVRERDEWEICRLPNAELIPLSEFASRVLDQVRKDEEVILYCHSGVRSERAGTYLVKNGYAKVRHLAGGIDAWSVEIDPAVKRYQ